MQFEASTVTDILFRSEHRGERSRNQGISPVQRGIGQGRSAEFVISASCTAPDTSGLNDYVNALQNGMGNEEVIAILIGSGEYYNNTPK